ncbi:RNA repair, ligase-Pnkp-associating, region of Hen1 [Sinosporangium album]|uniref:RNA repair, ligase-Pnkp-associating, region of Hen1 n=1 Tax=Sinosporangium album TaxID=504805 RepID=A0A1G8BH57_9ACTN|nr:RNA repair, ligase-Pnkp-associating, region of Hen1 [Sinosporangium album]
MQEFEQSYGTARVFYPEAEPGRCTAALMLDVDPVRLVRSRGRNSPDFALSQFVNDRPYASSSLLAVVAGEIAPGGDFHHELREGGRAPPVGEKFRDIDGLCGPLRERGPFSRGFFRDVAFRDWRRFVLTPSVCEEQSSYDTYILKPILSHQSCQYRICRSFVIGPSERDFM